MRTVTTPIAIVLVAALAALPLACSKDKSRTFVSIGTGSTGGVYYPAGGAIQEIVNPGAKTHGLNVTVKESEGSVQNINAVLTGDMDFGIAQADRVFQARNGQAEWADLGKQDKLCVVFALHSETINCIAANDIGATALAGLKGKAVNVGSPGSGQRQNAIEVLTASGLDVEKDIQMQGLVASESPSKLQDGLIDAFFYTVGHPNGVLKEAAAGQRRKVRFVPITGMDELMKTSPYYTAAVIPIRHYESAVNTEDVPTIGMKALLVCSSDADEEVVYTLVRQVLANMDTLTGKHEALADLTPESLASGGPAPLHPGAVRAFREAGLSVAE